MRRVLVVLCLGTSCGGGTTEPHWNDLALGHESAVLDRLQDHPLPEGLVLDVERGGVWVTTPLGAETWTPQQANSIARARPPVDLGLGKEVRLTSGGSPVAFRVLEDAGHPELATFLAHGTELPFAARYEAFLSLGRPNGRGAWQLTVGGVTAEGLGLWPGLPEVVRVDLPPGSRLRFHALARRLDFGGDRTPVRFEVLLDGALLARFEEPPGEPAPGTWHELDLPAGGGRGVELEFRVLGERVYGALLEPVVGPASLGERGARPWTRGEARPDLVLFLADTFRGDNLAVSGGDPDVAPNLNGLARRGLSFSQARAPSTWTLPSHASFFTGLESFQHTAVGPKLVLPDDAWTLAEELRLRGYRTAAITDGAFVSRDYGMQQGFDVFVERAERSLERTFAIALELLDRDDGRPTFLFVHTYRTHAPYLTGTDEDESAWSALGEASRALAEGDSPTGVLTKEMQAPLAGEWRELYREAARGLDAAFGPWLAELERRGLLEHGFLVVTSDHGEAFFEHDEMDHGGKPWDELLRVPLLIAGTGIEPRLVDEPVALVDLPRTLTDLVGLPPAEVWPGRSLLGALREAPVFAYTTRYEERWMSFVDRGLKVHAPPDAEALAAGRYDEAYDLTRDPGEETELTGPDAERAAALCRELAARVAKHLTPLFGASSAELSEEARRQMDALGY